MSREKGIRAQINGHEVILRALEEVQQLEPDNSRSEEIRRQKQYIANLTYELNLLKPKTGK
jgi:hypothetical protein